MNDKLFHFHPCVAYDRLHELALHYLWETDVTGWRSFGRYYPHTVSHCPKYLQCLAIPKNQPSHSNSRYRRFQQNPYLNVSDDRRHNCRSVCALDCHRYSSLNLPPKRIRLWSAFEYYSDGGWVNNGLSAFGWDSLPYPSFAWVRSFKGTWVGHKPAISTLLSHTLRPQSWQWSWSRKLHCRYNRRSRHRVSFICYIQCTWNTM